MIRPAMSIAAEQRPLRAVRLGAVRAEHLTIPEADGDGFVMFSPRRRLFGRSPPGNRALTTTLAQVAGAPVRAAAEGQSFTERAPLDALTIPGAALALQLAQPLADPTPAPASVVERIAIALQEASYAPSGVYVMSRSTNDSPL
jgi:hypothetical protein